MSEDRVVDRRAEIRPAARGNRSISTRTPWLCWELDDVAKIRFANAAYAALLLEPRMRRLTRAWERLTLTAAIDQRVYPAMLRLAAELAMSMWDYVTCKRHVDAIRAIENSVAVEGARR